MKEKKTVLFVCTHNSARSQMAEGMMNAFYGDWYAAYSAGTHPTAVNPHAVKVLSEIDVDISGNRSKAVDVFAGQKFDYVVTVCDNAKKECPVFPGAKKYISASFENPSEFRGTEKEVMAKFRGVRDEIREWMKASFIDGA